MNDLAPTARLNRPAGKGCMAAALSLEETAFITESELYRHAGKGCMAAAPSLEETAFITESELYRQAAWWGVPRTA